MIQVAICVRRLKPSLTKMCSTWFSTVPRQSHNRIARATQARVAQGY
jgi:hypothetical protein